MMKNETNITSTGAPVINSNNTNTTTTTSTTSTTFASTNTVSNGFTTNLPNITSTFSNFNCCSETTLTPSLGSTLSTESTTEVAVTVTESVHTFQRKIWAQDDYGDHVPYDEQYTTPTSILLLNFFLVIFLMIVIGVAVYPAVKKYCDSTFFGSGNGNTRYWIEDNEEVVSVLTSTIPECSFALLNRNNRNIEEPVDDLSTARSMEPLIDVRSEQTGAEAAISLGLH